MNKRQYDSTVARVAGNIAGAFVTVFDDKMLDANIARRCVSLARAIVDEVIRNESKEQGAPF